MSFPLNTIYADIESLGRADKYLEEIVEIIQHIKLFDDFGMDEIKVLCHHMRCYAAPRNYALLEEGAEGGYMVLILTGAADVRMTSGQGAEKVAEAVPGSTLGEASLVDGGPQLSSCIATVPTDFAVLSREALNRILLQAPRLGNKLLLTLLRLMSAQLRETCDRSTLSVV